VPFWQFFRNGLIGWIGNALLVQPSKTPKPQNPKTPNDYKLKSQFELALICIIILFYLLVKINSIVKILIKRVNDKSLI
jgi:hypothetical protein